MKKDNQISIYHGRRIEVEIFGASHAPQIGVVAKGFEGEIFCEKTLQSFLDRRRAKKSAFSTTRLEEDKVIFESGVKDGVIVGDLKAVIYNTKQHSADYDKVKKTPRPSHADYVAWTKYGDNFDFRGGGKFSGRMTAPMCIIGGICKQILEEKGIRINAYIQSIGKIQGASYKNTDIEKVDFSTCDQNFPLLKDEDKVAMLEEIENAKRQGDSVGGSIECVIQGLPVGCGEYMFDSLESVISHLAFAVPAVKGIEFGWGFDLASMKGSQANDFLFTDGKTVKTKTNHNGGINGGLSNGMPLLFRVAIKPTPSIALEQDTVDLEKMENVKLQIGGRHDACITPRAVAVIEAISALAIYDSIGE